VIYALHAKRILCNINKNERRRSNARKKKSIPEERRKDTTIKGKL
jgi:hypothetical protein